MQQGSKVGCRSGLQHMFTHQPTVRSSSGQVNNSLAAAEVLCSMAGPRPVRKMRQPLHKTPAPEDRACQKSGVRDAQEHAAAVC